MRAALLFFLACAIASAQTLAMSSGNGQVVQEQFRTKQPMVVQALDASGRPVSGVAVNWALVAGLGSIFVHDPLTDSNGYSRADFIGTSLQLGYSFLSSTIRAGSTYGSVNFFTTTVLSRLPGSGLAPLPIAQLETSFVISGPAGSIVPAAISVQVAAAAGSDSGKAIPNVGLRLEPKDPAAGPTAVCDAPGGIVLTDATGRATCNVKLGSIAGKAQLYISVGDFVVFSSLPVDLTITPGTACAYTLNPLAQNVAAGGGAGSFQVATAQGCSWAASTVASWINITSGGSGTGAGTVFFSTTANTGAQRSAVISVGNQVFAVTQNAAGTPGGSTLAFSIQSTLPSATANSAYSIGLTASGGLPPYQWSTTGALPPGLTLNPASGVLGGVPATPGSYTFPISVRDAANTPVSQTFTLTVGAPSPQGSLLITTTAFPSGSMGVPYQQPIAYAGGCQNPFSGQPAIALVTGALPTGLTLGSGGLSLGGTPTVAGVFPFALRIADSCGSSSTRDFTITIGGVPASAAMSATPSSLSFQAQAGGAAPAEQSIALATGTSAVAFAAQSDVPWLFVRPSNNTTPSLIVASIGNFSSLGPGTHQATIVVSSQASNSPFRIPVMLTLSPAAPATITVSPLLVSFAYTQGANSIQEQTVTVNSPVSTPFSTSVVTSGGGWLAVSPTGGSAPSPLRVVINTIGLSVGEYTGSVTIAPTTNPSAAQTVQVRLTVSAPATLTVSPSSLTFSATPGGLSPAPQSIGIRSTGATIGFTASASSNGWLSVSTTTGATPSNLGVTVNPTGLTAGFYQGSVSIIPESTRIPVVVAVSLAVSTGSIQLASVTNAASFSPGAVAPGEIVTIFGSNLGPSSPVGLELTSEGMVATTIGETRVLFDGMAAPLVYVSASQISAIVPYTTANRTSTRIEVEHRGVRSGLTEVAVVASSPGIFTAGGSQIAALNQDRTLNSSQNPADAGSVITFYATGEGQTTPVSQDGHVTGTLGPFPIPLLGVALTIGGQPAEILYAGAAPGLAAGVLQVNARIPAGLRGNAPVVLTVGQHTSQPNAVISVR